MQKILKNPLYRYYLFVNPRRIQTSDEVLRYDRTTFIISVPLFFYCGISRTSPRSHVELLDRLCEVWSTAVISIHSSVFWCLRAESESDEQRNGEESDNLFSRVSRRCCSYAASFFVYHIRIGETFFLPAGPWDQTGFHRRSAVTEHTAIPKSQSQEMVHFGFERTYFSKINLSKGESI